MNRCLFQQVSIRVVVTSVLACTDFITKHLTAFMATVEGTKPHVRAMGTYRADEDGIILAMQSPKDVCKQQFKNPEKVTRLRQLFRIGT